ncbi:hypothetical protein M8C21_013422, partial [Ambrosia artemisiifolia]
MGQRNMLYTGPILETEHGHIHPEPCVVSYGGMPSFPQPSNNNRAILPPSANQTSFNPQQLPEYHGPLPHGITQFNGLDHPPHHHPANNVFMTPTGAQVFPAPINHGIQDQLAFSNIRGSFENGQFFDVFKSKNAEGFPGNSQYFYPTPGSSSSVPIPMNTEGTLMGMEPMVHRSGRNRGSGAIGVDPLLAHSSSHLIPGNYGGQPPQAVPWLDQQFCGNGGDGGAFLWNHGPNIPYLQGPMSGGGLDTSNVGLHGCQVTSNRIPGTLVHPPAITPHQGPHNIHHLPPPAMPPMPGPNIEFHSQVASTSRRLPINTNVNPFQNVVEQPMPRFVGPAQPTGIRVFRPHRQELSVEATARHRVFPQLRVLPEDGVAILDISGYHEAGHSVDPHRDMRLDIDHMSYEAIMFVSYRERNRKVYFLKYENSSIKELLALGEQIGSAGSGLSDDFILEHLKTRVSASSKSSEPEDASSADHELSSCVICQ